MVKVYDSVDNVLNQKKESYFRQGVRTGLSAVELHPSGDGGSVLRLRKEVRDVAIPNCYILVMT